MLLPRLVFVRIRDKLHLENINLIVSHHQFLTPKYYEEGENGLQEFKNHYIIELRQSFVLYDIKNMFLHFCSVLYFVFRGIIWISLVQTANETCAIRIFLRDDRNKTPNL